MIGLSQINDRKFYPVIKSFALFFWMLFLKKLTKLLKINVSILVILDVVLKDESSLKRYNV